MGIATVAYKRPGKRSSTHNHLWQRTYHLEFLVETDDPNTGAFQVRTAVDPTTGLAIPRPGHTYFVNPTEQDAGSFATSITATEDDDGSAQQWTVAVDYGPYDAALFASDPTLWPIRATFAANKYERVVYFDQAGDAIVNSAGEPFGDPVTIDDSRSVITVERNELVAAFSPATAESYRDKVNSGAWNGFAAKTVKCASITTGQEQYDSNNQVWYYAVTYVFEINRDTWVKELLDQGFAVLDSSTPPKLKPVMNQGQPVNDPVPLDGSGHELAHGSTPVTLSFDVYPSADFGAFNLNLSVRLGTT